MKKFKKKNKTFCLLSKREYQENRVLLENIEENINGNIILDTLLYKNEIIPNITEMYYGLVSDNVDFIIKNIPKVIVKHKNNLEDIYYMCLHTYKDEADFRKHYSAKPTLGECAVHTTLQGIKECINTFHFLIVLDEEDNGTNN